MHEEEILDWVLNLRTSTPDVIENVDRKTLQVLINDVEHLAVFFYDDDSEACKEILEELETIDDDTDKHGIQFVKSKDAKLAAEIGIFSFPALVYYETGVPIMYDGDLMKEDEVLEWLIEQKSDGCFYIGMGAKSAKPTIPSYEPYQCCPSKVVRDTKVAKANPVSKINLQHDKPKRPAKQTPTTTTTPKPPALKPINKLSAKDSRKTLQAAPQKEEKPKKDSKAKKGFFGSVVAGLPNFMKI